MRWLVVFSILGVSLFANAKIVRLIQLDPGVWRGSQPTTPEDYQQLKSLGIKTILNLRWDDSVAESKSLAEANGFQFFNIPIVAADGPTDDDIKKAFAVILDKAEQPVYFHCTLGRDRTGLIAALYRVRVQNEDPQKAYDEWVGLGFARGFLRKMDAYFKNSTGLVASHQQCDVTLGASPAL